MKGRCICGHTKNEHHPLGKERCLVGGCDCDNYIEEDEYEKKIKNKKYRTYLRVEEYPNSHGTETKLSIFQGDVKEDKTYIDKYFKPLSVKYYKLDEEKNV